MSKVTFLPGPHSIEVTGGTTLLEAYQDLGLPAFSDCGGAGTCGKCQVRFLRNAPTPNSVELDMLSPVSLATGYRLACQIEAQGDVTVEVASYGSREAGGVFAEEFDSDFELGPSLQRLMPSGAQEQIAFDGTVLAERPADSRRLLGVAVDIGTTTLVGYLLDLETGQQLEAMALGNPQGVHGADVITRIGYASSRPDGVERLQELVVAGLNELLGNIFRKASVRPEDAYHAVVVGNPTMVHFFLGVDPKQIAGPPFEPVFKKAQWTTAGKLSLGINRRAVVETLPMVSGYVGADTMGMALFLRLDERDENCLAVDVGTNGEMILSRLGKLFACSTAAGPAFEGARIYCGMRAQAGAIDVVTAHVAERAINCHVVGNERPRGLCGTGLVSAVASFLDAGIVLPSGQFHSDGWDGHFRQSRSQRELLLADAAQTAHGGDVVLNQKDVRELQLAKGAVAAGAQRLMEHAGISLADLDHIYLAGAFGSRLDPRSALRIGLLPPVPEEKVVAVGNAAGGGAKMVLCSKEMRQVVADIAVRVEYVELTGDKRFDELFMEHLSFPSC